MPTYCYVAAEDSRGCARCKAGFDFIQPMSDPPLPACPHCGEAVKRAITAPGVNTQMSDKAKSSDKNLKRLGFKKLVKEGEGRYRNVL